MSKEAQVEQLTDYMAKFIAHVAKKLPDDVIAKLTELRAQEDSPLSKTIYDTMFQNQELAVKLNRPSCQDTGVRVIIGKDGMKENTERACKEFGAIHCVFPAGNAVVAATEVEEIVAAEWRDLGMPETLWNCRVKEFGPLIVSIDTEGNNWFEQQKVEFNKKKDAATEEICKQVGFIK